MEPTSPPCRPSVVPIRAVAADLDYTTMPVGTVFQGCFEVRQSGAFV
ncbi:hypothetical protein CEV32_3990 [Brucella rhizosphaerae]|uniref:Uncharacterized protein n=1 Tax=Brucella rhizosphaerae TaxID=571254 RepID=A0A256FR03_9HYPH|nr:hypothetical protein CEV32_3990 [Brucella rhizosphaerae]